MGTAAKVRVWRLDGIGEFLHVCNFAHPTSKVFHQTLAFCFVEQGSYRVRHRGVDHSVGEGALLVAQSGDLTSCEDFEGKSRFRVFHCAPEAMETIAEETGGSCKGRIFECPFVCDESLGPLYLRFHKAMDSSPTPIESSSLLRDLVGEMLARYGTSHDTSLRVGSERGAVKRVREYLESRYSETLTLEELAHVAQLSPFHLLRVFHEEVGLPPHAYQIRLRLNHARALLAQGATLGDAALTSGFFDQSHFANHFRKVFGYAPGPHSNGSASGSNNFQDC